MGSMRLANGNIETNDIQEDQYIYLPSYAHSPRIPHTEKKKNIIETKIT